MKAYCLKVWKEIRAMLKPDLPPPGLVAALLVTPLVLALALASWLACVWLVCAVTDADVCVETAGEGP